MRGFVHGRRAGAQLDEGTLHRRLARFNGERLLPRGPDDRRLYDDQRCQDLQDGFIERERARVVSLAAAVPSDPLDFVQWFCALRDHGPGQGDPLFPWLAEHASMEDMCWFLTQEVAGEIGFDDLVALTQVKLPTRAKLELARNYWDEMGRGQEAGMHGGLLERLVRHLQLRVDIDDTVWPALALGNLMVGLATGRHYAFHSIGALGVVELTAPDRVACVAAGLRRLGVAPSERLYFDLHAVLDRKHSQAWNQEVIMPLVTADPRVTRWIAEGALMRLTAGARCFACYHQQLAWESSSIGSNG
jgi:hypothetical protein